MIPVNLTQGNIQSMARVASSIASAIGSFFSSIKQAVCGLFRSSAAQPRPAAADLGGKSATAVAAKPQPSTGAHRRDSMSPASFAITGVAADSMAHSSASPQVRFTDAKHGAGVQARSGAGAKGETKAGLTVSGPGTSAPTAEAALTQAKAYIQEASLDNLYGVKVMRGNDPGETAVGNFIKHDAKSFIESIVDESLAKTKAAGPFVGPLAEMDEEEAAARAFASVYQERISELPSASKKLLQDLVAQVREKVGGEFDPGRSDLTISQRIAGNILVLKAIAPQAATRTYHGMPADERRTTMAVSRAMQLLAGGSGLTTRAIKPPPTDTQATAAYEQRQQELQTQTKALAAQVIAASERMISTS